MPKSIFTRNMALAVFFISVAGMVMIGGPVFVDHVNPEALEGGMAALVSIWVLGILVAGALIVLLGAFLSRSRRLRP